MANISYSYPDKVYFWNLTANPLKEDVIRQLAGDTTPDVSP